MSKKLTVTVDKPILEESNSSLVHSATSWQISKIPDFTNRDYLLVESLNDSNNLLELEYTLDIDSTESLYLRTKYHFDNGQETKWSRIIPIRGDQIGIKLSQTVVATPIVTYEVSYKNTVSGEIVLKTNEMRLYAGAGTHKSTSWKVVDVDGKVIFDRAYDEDNLTSIILDHKMIDPSKIYIIKAKFHTDTNTDSNYGKVIMTTFNGRTSLFDIYAPYPMVPNRWLYTELKLYTPDFSRVDLIIKDEYGKVVAENLDQLSRTPRIFTGNLEVYRRYTVLGRVKLTDGSVTEYKPVMTTTIRPNTLIDFNNRVSYLDKFSFNQELLLNGLTVQSGREIYSGDILLAKHNDNKIYRYSYENNKLNESETTFVLDGEYDLFDKPYINILPLYDGRVLIDYAADKNGEIVRRSTFKLYDFNTITKQFNLLKTLHRDNELYGTALTTSAVVMNNEQVFYIPNKEIDTQGNEKELKMKILNLSTFSIDEEIDLPYIIKRHATIVKLDDDNIMLVSGANTTVVDESGEDWKKHVTVWHRTTNDTYVYNIKNKTWTKVGTLHPSTPLDLYAFQAYTRRDKKIVLFNNVDTGSTLGNQDTYVIDPVTYIVSKIENDYGDSLAYRSSIVLNNGDILRISSRAIDPQKVYKYISNTMSEEEIVDNLIIDTVKDLVVRRGEVITIESPYRFETITIEGDDYDNSGILRWIDGDDVREFKFRDKIITRPTELINNLYDPVEDWDTLTILDDANLDVINVIIVPDNVTFDIHTPFNVSYIILGEGSKLNVISE